MITLSLIEGGNEASSYYSSEDNYYLSEVEAGEYSIWWGEGSKKLSIDEKKVDKDLLQELMLGKLPNGEIVGTQGKHRAGYDICFHAPKSVSILAIEGKDQRFYQAHLNAVKETLLEIEKDCASIKSFKQGNLQFDKTNNLTFALMRHVTSREKDVHLHTHALTLNFTEYNGKWKALASSRQNILPEVLGFSEKVYKNQIYYGLLYKSSLANQVKKLGCEIEIVGPHGMWEIKDFPKAALSVMSKRRNKIEEKLETLDGYSYAQADTVTLQTREAKNFKLTKDELQKSWHEQLQEIGFSSKEFLQKLELNKANSYAVSKDASLYIKEAVEHFMPIKLQISYEEIMSKALEYSLGNVKHSELVYALEKAIKESELISSGRDETKFIAKEMLKIEQNLIDKIKNGNASKSLETKIKASEGKQLQYTNNHIIIDLLSSGDKYNLVDSAQSDNFVFLDKLLKISDKHGLDFEIVSSSNAVNHSINSRFQVEQKGLLPWLKKLFIKEDEEIGNNLTRYLHKTDSLPSNKAKGILVVYHAETLGTYEVNSLLNKVHKQEGTKVIFLNDANGKEGFSAGNPLSLFREAGIKRYKLTGNTLDCPPIFKEIKNPDERISQVASTYNNLSETEKRNTKIIVTNQKQILALNNAIRAGLKEKGILGGREIEINALIPKFLDNSDKRVVKNHKEAEYLKFYRGEYKGLWKIEDIDIEKNLLNLQQGNRKYSYNPKQNEITSYFHSEKLKLSIGDCCVGSSDGQGIKKSRNYEVSKIKENVITLKRGKTELKLDITNPLHLKYGYAETIHAEAKEVKNNVIAMINSNALSNDFIRALSSKAKERLEIYTDSVSTAKQNIERELVRQNAKEAINPSYKKLLSDKLSNLIQQMDGKIPYKNDLSEKAIEYGLTKIADSKSVFTEQEILSTSLAFILENYGFGNKEIIGKQELKNILDDKIAIGSLKTKEIFGSSQIATQDSVIQEQKIVQLVKESKDKVKPLVNEMYVNDFLEKSHLNNGQKQAIKKIATTKDQFTVVQGYAGTGKTTLFAEFKDLLRETDLSFKVKAVAPTHRAVQELRDRGLSAQTLKSFLIDKSATVNSKDCIILDEASMVDNRDFMAFLEKVKQSKNHVILSGDTAQLLSVGAGKPFELIQETGALETVKLDEVIRQKKPKTKALAQAVIAGDFTHAFSLLQNSKSIIEVNNLKNKHSLEKRIADDYVKQSKVEREDTAVIVHANKDREVINNYIREELKKKGDLSKDEAVTTISLTNKQLSKIDLKLIGNYKVGDIVKINQEYWSIKNSNYTTKSVKLESKEGEIKYLYPDRTNKNLELYHPEEKEIAKGDFIRFTKTDTSKEKYASFEYTAVNVTKEHVYLENNKGKKQILEVGKLNDGFWDYAYTSTAYGIQGASKANVLDFEVSKHKALTNQRSFYIAATRAINNIKIYTDDKKKLYQQLITNKGERLVAQDILPMDQKQVGTKKLKTPETDIASLKNSLVRNTENIIQNLLGQKNEKLSTSTEWRYGNKGSLAINLRGDKKGLWFNFETGESGDLLDLIAKKTQSVNFKEVVAHAQNFLGNNLTSIPVAPKPEQKEPIEIETKDKTKEYGSQLVKESKEIKNTIVEKYLTQERGIKNINKTDLRYHPKVYVGDHNEVNKYLPAMLALGRNKTGEIQCVQATYLNEQGKKAEIDIQKRTYSSPSAAMVKFEALDRTSKTSYIVEGVETGLSVRDAVKGEVFVCLGKNNFNKIDPTQLNKEVIFCIDNDGTKALNDPNLHKAMDRLQDMGKEVKVAIPKQIDGLKTDFNDVSKKINSEETRLQINNSISLKEFKELHNKKLNMEKEL